MPITQITLLPGYDQSTRERLVQRVSDAVRSVIAASPAGTTTLVMEAATYQRDGRVFDQGGASHLDAGEQVRAFLTAMQARDLETAKQMLSADFKMTFPGNANLTTLEQLVQWGRTRYQQVGKVIDRVEQSWQPDGTVVYCFGTLFGVWPDGQAFEGIRFIDRFKVVDNLIVEQQVWNDLAEVRTQVATSNPV